MHALSPRILLPLWAVWLLLACGSEMSLQPETSDTAGQDSVRDSAPNDVDESDVYGENIRTLPPWETVVDNPIWTLTIAPKDLAILEEDVFADVEVPATLLAEGAIYNIDIRFQGGSSRAYPKKNYRLNVV